MGSSLFFTAAVRRNARYGGHIHKESSMSQFEGTTSTDLSSVNSTTTKFMLPVGVETASKLQETK